MDDLKNQCFSAIRKLIEKEWEKAKQEKSLIFCINLHELKDFSKDVQISFGHAVLNLKTSNGKEICIDFYTDIFSMIREIVNVPHISQKHTNFGLILIHPVQNI